MSASAHRALGFEEMGCVRNFRKTLRVTKEGDLMPTSTEALTRRWFDEIWTQRRIGTAEAMISPRLVGWSNGRNVSTYADFRTLYEEFTSAFPDIRLEIEDLVAAGDRAAVRWRARGTHTGAGLGIPASGRSVDFLGSTWLEFEDGKLVRAWDLWNLAALFAELTSR